LGEVVKSALGRRVPGAGFFWASDVALRVDRTLHPVRFAHAWSAIRVPSATAWSKQMALYLA
jgi:hypothetical protein